MTEVEHRFVDQVPDDLGPGILYVSLPFRTTVHLCACGCGNETWVPIRPEGHHLMYDGETITIEGSIGNWRFPCRSHYWIRSGRIVWTRGEVTAPRWRRALSRLRDLFQS